MAEIKPKPSEKKAIEQLSRDLEKDAKLGERLVNDTHSVLRKYKLTSLIKRAGDPLILELRWSHPTMSDPWGWHWDSTGGHLDISAHSDVSGHSDVPKWHVDL